MFHNGKPLRLLEYNIWKGLNEMANNTNTPMTEKTDLRTQLAEVAERIRTMREIMGLSEEEMAQRTNVSVEDYRKYERGESDFSFTFIFKCAERFGIDRDRAVNYHCDAQGTALNYEVVGEAVSYVRACKAPLSADWKRRIEEDFAGR